MSTVPPVIVHVSDHPGFWHLDLTTLIGALGLFFAWRAAHAAMTTVRDTREMRWEANLNRVLEALIAIEGAARDLDPAERNPLRLDQYTRQERLRNAQLELRRSLVFPRILTNNDEANNILDLLQSRADLGANPKLTRAYARQANVLLSTQPPGKTWPRPVLLTMTFIPRQRARLREWRAGRRPPAGG